MIYIIIAIVVVLLIFVISSYNGLVRLKNMVGEAFSTMDVYLKKRWDLIPNLVNTVKGYAKHESETLEKVISMRTGTNSYDKLSAEEKIEANKELSGAISKLMMVAEAYPDLKANENFKDLSAQLTKVEEDIANARKYYNGTVRKFNDKIMMFPSNLIAGMFGFKTAAMYEIEESERQNVKVEF